MTLILPKDYHPSLTIRDTEAAIVFIRETFQDKIADKLTFKECQHQCLLKNLLD